MEESRAGRPAWSLRAKIAFLNEGSQSVFMSEPRLEFFKAGRPDSQARSKSGTADLESRDVILSSSVVAESLTDKTVLRTERLVYSDAARKFKTDHAVVLTRPGAVMRGKGLEANADLSELRIFRQEAQVESGP